MKCCICGNDIRPQRNELGQIVWSEGHNAQPVKDGRCCDECNWSVVIAARLVEAGLRK